VHFTFFTYRFRIEGFSNDAEKQRSTDFFKSRSNSILSSVERNMKNVQNIISDEILPLYEDKSGHHFTFKL